MPRASLSSTALGKNPVASLGPSLLTAEVDFGTREWSYSLFANSGEIVEAIY